MSRIGTGVVARKSRRLASVARRLLVRRIESDTDGQPPVIVNSVPKSGTHLLLQVLSSLPNLRRWGLFLASQPSFRFREIPERRLATKIRGMANREIAGAHLHWSRLIQEACRQRGVIKFFIYRDPRDVVVSEAYYLAEMNRWHRLHGRFRAIADPQERIRLSIEGLSSAEGPVYPDIARRYERFLPWLEDPDVLAVRYEDLVGDKRASHIERVIRFWLARQSEADSASVLTRQAIESIQPQRSHTFRRGQAGGWREAMDAETKSHFSRRCESLVTRLGYPPTEAE